jgi:uncharacterized membrane protein
MYGLSMILSYLKMGVGLIGVAIIVMSCGKAVVYFLVNLFKKKSDRLTKQLRLDLGYDIILALEFIVAADIIESIVRPTYYDLGILGALVIIRTFLSYFLNKELEHLTSHERNAAH